MWKIILTPAWLRHEFLNCYDKYSNDLHYADARLINVAYMKFVYICVHSIKNYLRMSQWCISFLPGIFHRTSVKYDGAADAFKWIISFFFWTNLWYTLFLMLVSAPLLSSIVTASASPHFDAKCKGQFPSCNYTDNVMPWWCGQEDLRYKVYKVELKPLQPRSEVLNWIYRDIRWHRLILWYIIRILTMDRYRRRVQICDTCIITVLVTTIQNLNAPDITLIWCSIFSVFIFRFTHLSF